MLFRNCLPTGGTFPCPRLKQILAGALAAVPALVDPAWLHALSAWSSVTIDQPTVPVETYLRLMYLKHRYGFGYETLVQEITDSLHWRRFCHLALDAQVPHPTTLSKLTRKYGPAVVQELNQHLVRQACARKVVGSRKPRVDTTVIQAPIE